MGGERETTLDAGRSKTARSKPQEIEGKSGSKIRIHESGGEVHFHDDENKRKVAIPVARWSRTFDKISTEPADLDLPDTKNKTVLRIRSRFKKGTFDVRLEIETLNVGTTLAELSKFTNP